MCGALNHVLINPVSLFYSKRTICFDSITSWEVFTLQKAPYIVESHLGGKHSFHKGSMLLFLSRLHKKKYHFLEIFSYTKIFHEEEIVKSKH